MKRFFRDIDAGFWAIGLIVALAFVITCKVTHLAVAHVYYISQGGSATLTASTQPLPANVTTFNVLANWSNTAGQVGKICPGDTVYIEGNLTTALSFGASGNGTDGPITLIFDNGSTPGSMISGATPWPSTGAIIGNSKNYLVIDGLGGAGLGGTGTQGGVPNFAVANGVIGNTTNGTLLANQVLTSCFINMGQSSNCVVRNIYFTNQYVHVPNSVTDEGVNHEYACIRFAPNTPNNQSNNQIYNNACHDCISFLVVNFYGLNQGWQVYDNAGYNINWGVVFGDAENNSTLDSVTIAYNTFTDYSIWDDTGANSTTSIADTWNIAGSYTSGTFSNQEKVIQATTLATAIVSGAQSSGADLVVYSVTLSPDATHTWTGQSSGATFAPTAVPVDAPGGIGYQVGDHVVPNQPGASGCQFHVVTLAPGSNAVQSIALDTPGGGYGTRLNTTTTNGSGQGLALNLNVTNAYHHDGIFPFTTNSGSTITNTHVFGNYLGWTGGAARWGSGSVYGFSTTADIFFVSGYTGAGNQIVTNVMLNGAGDAPQDGDVYMDFYGTSGLPLVANNTFIGNGTGVALDVIALGPTPLGHVIYKNNLVQGMTFINVNTAASIIVDSDYNLGYQLKVGFNTAYELGNSSSFHTWQSSTGGWQTLNFTTFGGAGGTPNPPDPDSVAGGLNGTIAPGIDPTTYMPTSGASEVVGNGTNLSAYFVVDGAGNGLPLSGPWPIGAFNYATGPTPTPTPTPTPSATPTPTATPTPSPTPTPTPSPTPTPVPVGCLVFFNAGFTGTLTETVAHPAVLSGFNVFNPNAFPVYLQFFDSATTGGIILGAQAPVFGLMVPTGPSDGILDSSEEPGPGFYKGVVVACTTTNTGSTNPALPIVITLFFN